MQRLVNFQPQRVQIYTADPSEVVANQLNLRAQPWECSKRPSSRGPHNLLSMNDWRIVPQRGDVIRVRNPATRAARVPCRFYAAKFE